MAISLACCLDYSIITASLLAPLSLWWSRPCAGSHLVISGRNNFCSLASFVRASPHPAHKPPFTVGRLTSTFINHKQAPLLFSPRAWEELLIKNVQCSPLSSSLCFQKDWTLQAKILSVVCQTHRMAKIILCSLVSVSLGLVFMLVL